MNDTIPPMQALRNAIAARDEWSPAFPDTSAGGYPGYAVHFPRVVKALAGAFGGSPAAWEAATEAVFNGPTRLRTRDEIEPYLKAAATETAVRLHFLAK